MSRNRTYVLNRIYVRLAAVNELVPIFQFILNENDVIVALHQSFFCFILKAGLKKGEMRMEIAIWLRKSFQALMGLGCCLGLSFLSEETLTLLFQVSATTGLYFGSFSWLIFYVGLFCMSAAQVALLYILYCTYQIFTVMHEQLPFSSLQDQETSFSSLPSGKHAA